MKKVQLYLSIIGALALLTHFGFFNLLALGGAGFLMLQLRPHFKPSKKRK